MEPFAGEAVVAALREAGADVRTGRRGRTRSRERPAATSCSSLSDGTAVRAAEVLVATGRVPRTGRPRTRERRAGAWIVARRGRHPARPRCRLALRGGRRQPPRAAHASGQVPGARRRATSSPPAQRGKDVDDAPWGAHVATADHSAVPQVTFTDPEVASVGHTEASARAAGIGIRVVDYDLSWVVGGEHARRPLQRQGASDRRRDRAACSSARRSSGRTSPSCFTPPPSRSSARCRSSGSGMRCRHIRRSARSGCAGSRRSAARAADSHLLVAARTVRATSTLKR